jgi:hypothetical protein
LQTESKNGGPKRPPFFISEEEFAVEVERVAAGLAQPDRAFQHRQNSTRNAIAFSGSAGACSRLLQGEARLAALNLGIASAI